MSKVLNHSTDVQAITDPDEKMRADLMTALIPFVNDAVSPLEDITMSVYGRIGAGPIAEATRELSLRDRGREICIDKFNDAANLLGIHAMPRYGANLDYVRKAVAFMKQSGLGIYRVGDDSPAEIPDIQTIYETFLNIAGKPPKTSAVPAPRGP